MTVAHSVAVLGVGYGSLAMAGLGMVGGDTGSSDAGIGVAAGVGQAQAAYGRYGSGWRPAVVELPYADAPVPYDEALSEESTLRVDQALLETEKRLLEAHRLEVERRAECLAALEAALRQAKARARANSYRNELALVAVVAVTLVLGGRRRR